MNQVSSFALILMNSTGNLARLGDIGILKCKENCSYSCCTTLTKASILLDFSLNISKSTELENNSGPQRKIESPFCEFFLQTTILLNRLSNKVINQKLWVSGVNWSVTLKNESTTYPMHLNS